MNITQENTTKNTFKNYVTAYATTQKNVQLALLIYIKIRRETLNLLIFIHHQMKKSLN
ncbi:hypothetical protein EUS_13010 [[Eubacterium] siraeum 70/3]|uniref:Uncharacterized protein n=1 Tax=[Eubacterium] siraeum 70/3 TaxID=657319 RepID=D4JTN7_9FIRM|nr:hypothetical protein EUS_13010 [[Eubacterium] siraeum 70/3]